jgi:hypothetical protein
MQPGALAAPPAPSALPPEIVLPSLSECTNLAAARRRHTPEQHLEISFAARGLKLDVREHRLQPVRSLLRETHVARCYTRCMPKFVLSAHAETVMAERSIKREWVERILSNPAKIDPDRTDAELKHALGRISEHGNRVLRVVYNGAVRPPMVVTVYFDRAMKGKL